MSTTVGRKPRHIGRIASWAFIVVMDLTIGAGAFAAGLAGAQGGFLILIAVFILFTTWLVGQVYNAWRPIRIDGDDED